jgi:hypothetical protein
VVNAGVCKMCLVKGSFGLFILSIGAFFSALA